MKIINISEREAEIFDTDVPYIHISIRSPKADPITLQQNKYCKGYLTQNFHDIDKEYKNYKTFTRINAIVILDFVKLFIEEIELIVVNCEAGVSRSAGIAGALSKLINGDDSAYFKHSLPNMLVYRTILNVANDINWRR